MTDPLRECPFCGSSAQEYSVYSRTVCCDDCEATGPVARSGIYHNEAARLWNTRPAPSDWVAVGDKSTWPLDCTSVLVSYRVVGDRDLVGVGYQDRACRCWRVFAARGAEEVTALAWQPLPKAYTPPTPDLEGEE